MSFLARNKQIIIYGVAFALIVFLLKWLEMRYVLADERMETYGGLVAIIFTALGIWLALKLRKPKIQTVIVERRVVLAGGPDFVFNEDAMKRLNLSKRELEVLALMAEGLSNQEIAARLFVSLNTVKTHSAQIFEKMEVKRRTQAVDIGKKLSLIP